MRAGVARRFNLGRLAKHRRTVIGYCQILAGTGGRLALQVIYFLVLANALSLADMGIFASVSAAGMMIGCFAAAGFQSFVFRSAAGKRSAMPGYLSAYYAAFFATMPLTLAASGVLYVAIFSHTMSFAGFAAIIVVEVVLWRLIELIVQINNGLGRYGAAAAVVSLPVAFRATAAVLFWSNGGGNADAWAWFYLAGNTAALAFCAALFHPRFRFRLRLSVLRARLSDGLLYAMSAFVFVAQNEVDKIVILMFAGERTAGIYAIAMRVIDLTVAPLRPVFVMYSRKLIQAGRATPALVRECLMLEFGVGVASIVGILGFIGLLWLWPGLLGQNVSTALGMLALIFTVPAFRNLLEFHGELFFAFDHMAIRAAVTGTLAVLKAAALAGVLLATSGTDAWGIWLNAIYAGVYAISFAVIYRLLTRTAAT